MSFDLQSMHIINFKCMKLSKRVWLIVGLGVVFLVGSFFLLRALLYPDDLRLARKAYNQLADSCEQEPYCHEDCFVKRNEYRSLAKVGLKYLNFRNFLEGVVLNENVNVDLRLETIRIFVSGESDLNIPKAWLPLLDSGNPRVQTELLRYYQVAGVNSVIALKVLAASSSAPVADRERAIANLMMSKDDTLFPLYLKLLDDQKVRTAALIALNNIGDKEKYYDAKLLSDIQARILDINTELYFRRDLVSTLANFPKAMVSGAIKTICLKNLDPFSTNYAARIIVDEKICKPIEISAADWQAYEQGNYFK